MWAKSGLDVTLLARGSHLDAIQTSGLTVKSIYGDSQVKIKAISDPEKMGEIDLVFFATKSWQLEEAIKSVAPHVSSTAMVMGIQNGVESADELAARFPASNVLGATCRIVSYIEAPGVIHHMGVPPTISFGELKGNLSDRVLQLQPQLNLGESLTVEASANIQSDIWQKFIFFAPVSGVGSVTRSPVGEFRKIPETRRLLQAAIEEVHTLSIAQKIPLPIDSVTNTLKFIDSMPVDMTSSMQRDFEDGRLSELEYLSGAVCKMGKRFGVETPANSFIYAALRPQEDKVRARY
ncbi:ketopantoate reductase family protein [Aliikangiella coralliicola]|uniref:2-dehydropantoate 2-reductase n=1 Tax=Aliikangiella coralliicola TaxID=2592383 RepID=A0A545UDU2_9GAMM|nr:ketopantoate reductase family protein [Aliikangiella coralliicola]